jgi:hypothetical protein
MKRLLNFFVFVASKFASESSWPQVLVNASISFFDRKNAIQNFNSNLVLKSLNFNVLQPHLHSVSR